MSKKYSPTSISSKQTKSKKDLPQSKESELKKSIPSQKSSSQSSNNESELSESQISMTQQKVMEEAIEKASCLIELLTRENSDSKLYINDLLQELTEIKSKNQELEITKNQLLDRLMLVQTQSENLQKQNEEMLFELEKIKLQQNDEFSSKQKLEQTKTKNKKLHEKIAFLTKNNVEINRELEHLKKQFKSLQNENKYLLDELKRSESKQNVFYQNLSFKQSHFEKKIRDIETTKQAFAARTHELKEQNLILLKEIQELRRQKYDLELISRQSMQTLDAVTKKIESYRFVEQKVHRIYEKIKFVMEEGTTQPFSRMEVGIKEKLEQIQMLVAYRVQHIENLMKKICERVEKPEWKCNLRELNEAKILAQRLSTYLSELSGKPSLQF